MKGRRERERDKPAREQEGEMFISSERRQLAQVNILLASIALHRMPLPVDQT